MKKIVVIGGGFAGISALVTLRRLGKSCERVLIDKRRDAHFLPLLPDIIGRGITADALRYSLQKVCVATCSSFIHDEVTAIDFDKGEISTPHQKMGYDYVIIAGGSETNFYGNATMEERAYSLDTVDDALILRSALETMSCETAIIVGGGYTGIEIATNLWLYAKKKHRAMRIIIVERAPAIVGMIPEWMGRYVRRNLAALGIEVVTNCSLSAVEDKKATLSNGSVFEDALVIWSAGVKANSFVGSQRATQDRQGRIYVDEYMRLSNNCFIAGDAAHFALGENALRMAVQFSLAEGRAAAINIMRSMQGRPLKKYRPLDLGYIVPMANNSSCGKVLGVNVRGRTATFFHYCMCCYRLFGIKNRMRLLFDLLGNR